MFVVVVTSSTSLKILLPNDILVSKNGVLFGNDDDDRPGKDNKALLLFRVGLVLAWGGLSPPLQLLPLSAADVDDDDKAILLFAETMLFGSLAPCCCCCCCSSHCSGGCG